MTAAAKTEEKTAHTPGPWEQQDYAVCVAFNSDHCIMYKPNRTPRTVKASEYIANARLIAAAPDMLEALKEAQDLLASLPADLKELGTMGAEDTACKMIAAIAKAEGETA